MALNQNDMNAQKLLNATNQLVEQLKVTQSTKKDMDIDDIIKAINQTFKTTKEDTGELKTFLKIAKNVPNAEQYTKLTKMLDLLLKTYNNPDLKQMKRLGITSQNLVAEISSLRDELKSSNILSNEKANLSILSKAIAEGQRQYAVTGFGKDASNFYKKATLDQLKLLGEIHKAIDEGNPLKNIGKKTVTEKVKDAGKSVLRSGPLGAAADLLLKGMGFGTLPGEFLDMFANSGNKDKTKQPSKKEQRQALAVSGLVTAKEKSQQSLEANKTVQNRANEVKGLAESAKKNLTVDVTKSLADAMRISGNIEPKYAKEENPNVVDTDKIQQAVANGEISKEQIQELMANANKSEEGNESNNELTDSLLKNLDEIQEYSKVIEEQDKTITETANNIQTSIDTISTLFLDLREILGKELNAEIKKIGEILDNDSRFKGLDDEARQGLKDEAINYKLANMAEVAKVSEDEIHGIIGGEDRSGYMKEFEKQGELGKTGRTHSELATEAFSENTFKNAIFGEEEAPANKVPGSEFEEKLQATNDRLAQSKPTIQEQLQENKAAYNMPKVAVPKDLEIPEEKKEELPVPEEEGQQMSFDEMSDIMSDTLSDFLKSFEETMKSNDRDSKQSMDAISKALLSGQIKVNVVNLKDIPSGGRDSGMGGNSPLPQQSSNKQFGDED